MSVRCILFVVVSLSLTCWAAEEDTSVISSDPLVIGELPSLEEFRSGIIQQQPVEVVIATTPEVFIDNDPDVVLIGSDDGKIKRTNFAAARIGAVISSTNPEAKGASSLLTSDPDNYWMSPCSAKKWVVITLPEDVSASSP